jgi:hypothetical protein
MAACAGVFLLLAACSDKTGQVGDSRNEEARFLTANVSSLPITIPVQDAELFDRLDRLAEQERSTGFEVGVGLRESAIREQGGDYAGAVFATFKELLWAYSFARGEEQAGMLRTTIENGFGDLMETLAQSLSPAFAESANQAALAALAFFAERYEEAGALLAGLQRDKSEPDEFAAWMGLVCALENAANAVSQAESPQNVDESTLRQLRASYAAIRSRYETLPAYWYFGARNMKGESIPAYAERAINLSPNGPYAADARAMIAAFTGLSREDGKSIMSMYEIETVVVNAVNAGNPAALAELFPLIALPDNPYTLYAAGALRGLASEARFKNYFDDRLKASGSSGKKPDRAEARLAERLTYIVRG